MLRTLTILAPVAAVRAWDVANTPMMGFNTWNLYQCAVDAGILTSTATAMVQTGLKDAGYTYVNSDDCWMSQNRSTNGSQVPDPNNPTAVSTISVDFTVFGATAGASFSVQDVWQGTSAGVHKGLYSALVPPQAVAYLILTPVDDTRQRLKSDDQSSSPPQLRLGAARLKVDDADAGSVTVDVTPAQAAQLGIIVAAHPAGTTYRFHPGTYRLGAPLRAKDGDTFEGATSCAPPKPPQPDRTVVGGGEAWRAPGVGAWAPEFGGR